MSVLDKWLDKGKHGVYQSGGFISRNLGAEYDNGLILFCYWLTM